MKTTFRGEFTRKSAFDAICAANINAYLYALVGFAGLHRRVLELDELEETVKILSRLEFLLNGYFNHTKQQETK